MASKDNRQRRRRRETGGALMGALGTAMTAGAEWYDKEQIRKAQELKDQQLLALKAGELKLGRDRMDESARLGDERNRISGLNAQNQADQIKGYQDRFESTAKKQAVGTFLGTDLPNWQKNYIGDDEDAKLRSKAWASVLSNDLSSYDDEQLAGIAAKIEEQFGTGASGKPLLTLDQISEGIGQLRTYADMRGLDVNDVSDDDIRSLLSSSFTLESEAAPGEAGDALSLMGGGDEASAGEDQPFGLGLSESLSGIGDSVMGVGDSLRGYSSGELPASEQPGDRGIRMTPEPPSGAMGQWWLNLDPQEVAAMPDSALAMYPEAIKWLKEQGLR